MNRECLFCGTVLEDENRDYICPECNEKMILLKQIKKVDAAAIKMGKVTERCFRHTRYYAFEDEKYRVVKKLMNGDVKFNSTEEACVALECEKENIKYFTNYKIGSYKVDFLFPELKIIFEVDGELYHNDPDKDFIRERGIMNIVGEEYEIVRLSTDYIPNYIILNFKESLSHVIFQRNSNNHFRDTRYDSMYFGEYLQLAGYMRRRRR